MDFVTDYYFKNAPIGFVCLRKIKNLNKRGTDYEILQINDFIFSLVKDAEKYLNIKRLSILSEKLGQNIFDWIDSYYDRVEIEKRIEVEKFAEIFSGWYNFTMIMAQNDIMCIWIEDITAEKIIIDISQKIIDSNTIDYHELAESARRIADAKYCLMNIFSKDEEYFKTVAAAGKRRDLSIATKILGINPEKKVWKSDCHFLNKLRLSHISQFKRVSDFMGDSIPNKLLNTLMSALNIGNFYLCRIQKDNKFVGVFTLVAQKGKSIKNKNKLITYSQQVGLYLLRNKTIEKETF